MGNIKNDMDYINVGYRMHLDTNGDQFYVEQNLSDYLDYAERSRKLSEENSKAGVRYRSFCIIPDIVAIDIMNKHGINVHSETFGQDPAEVAKLKRIIISEFPKLLTSNVMAGR